MCDFKRQAKQFKALSDDQRLKIISLLQGGEQCACQLLEQMSMSQSTLSYHMKILCESGIVEGRQDGKWVHYHIDEQGSKSIISMLLSLTTTHQEAAGEIPGCACGEH